ncbi:MAG: RdgB/HAM1 family non-canonical purine NTP pyrophosphatase [Rhodothermia bacterium]|nr:MAG: RdgB/HAM1 family non-canonical purine NTP pyrophosphatase [Rhodothermia bacterium]
MTMDSDMQTLVKKMREIVVASGNQGKVREIEMLLKDLAIRTLSLEDFPSAPGVNEDKATLEGNALKKAREIADFTGLPTVADDTGLEVDALNGRPGVLSARYAGPDSNSDANRALLLSELDGIEERTARFTTVAAFVDDDEVHLFEGTCEGVIAVAERGEGGFGYDSIFIPETDTRTFAEMSADEKNLVSHRSKAFEKFAAFLGSEEAKGS